MTRRVAAIAAGLALVGVGVFAWELYRPYRGYSRNQLLTIEPGMRAPAVARLLVDRGVLAHRWPFLVRYWLGRARHHTLKSGEYLFDRPLAPIDVYQKLIRGEVYLHAVVIPEGSDRFDIARALQEQLGMKPEEFLRVTQQTHPRRDVDPQAPTLEGYLFPDTYRFPRGVTPAAVVAAMLGKFHRVLDSRLRRELRHSSRSLHDLITLASLVEKETPDPSERILVAAVFTKRLEKVWPLQCDPTVIYAARLRHRTIGTSTTPITQSDLEIDSPYNTYRHTGLPPGPICNPGVASIRAALEPATVDLLYFVSNHHGGHVFARTLAEHKRNVARYRREVAALRHASPEVKSHVQ